MHIIFAFVVSVGVAVVAFGSPQSLFAAEPTRTVPTEALLTPTHIETLVRAYFAQAPEMPEIARCESEFRQYDTDGSVLRGGFNKDMLGVFQFYEAVHAEGAAALGHDLATLKGNLAYAKHVYEEQGTTPWNSSRDCWERAPAATDVEAERAALLEKIQLLTKLLTLLQQQVAAR